MKPTDSNTGRYPYRILNRIFLLLLILILAYSALYSPENKSYRIPSGSLFFSDSPVSSTGLSRSFSAIMRFRFEEARQYNANGIRLFLFFFIQLFMRLAGLLLSGHLPERSLPLLYNTDAMLSTALFIACFWPFLCSFYLNFFHL